MHKKVVFKSYCQEQQFLLPKNIDDFVVKGHIARLISEVIENMDISHIIKTYKGGGTSSYNPKMLLKTWILGFVYRIYSCRLLAKATRENLPFIWIAGNQQPDFKTLNNFRLRLKDEIKKVFKEIVRYGIEQGIIKGEDVFVDHTKNEANSNKHKIIWKKQVENQLKKIDEEIDELFTYIDGLNEKEEKIFGNKDLPEQERKGFDDEKVKKVIDKINERVKNKEITKEKAREDREKVKRAKQLIEREDSYKEKHNILGGRNSYSRTDKGAVAMMMKDKVTIKPAYNEGIAVEKGFVLDYVISDNAADNVSFIPLMEGVIENLGKAPENANSDGAYGNEENHAFLEEKKIGNFLKFNSYHKEKSKAWREKMFRLEDFTYDEDKDEFTCRNSVTFSFLEAQERKTKTGYLQKFKLYKVPEDACVKCPFRDKCTKSNTRTLQVSWNAERLKKQARENLNSDKGKELRKRRGNEVESVFGEQKLNKLKRRYHLRGLLKVNIEAGLYYISHNLKKLHTISQNKFPSDLKNRGSEILNA